MFTTAHPPLRNTLSAVAATFLCTGVTLAALDSPAHAATTSRFAAAVERQLSDGYASSGENGIATVAVRIDAEGRVISAGLVGPSGHASLDRDALQRAKSVAYPKGQSRSVAVVMKYGNARLPSQAESAALVSRYTDAQGRALAAGTIAPNAG